MASEEDNFDIDIYGDGGEDHQVELEGTTGPDHSLATDSITEPHNESAPESENISDPHPPSTEPNPRSEMEVEDGQQSNDVAQKIASTDASAADPVHLPKQAPQQQGFKREDGSTDERFVDPNASTALLVSELHWWVNDDDIRGWANQCRCEDELEEITFSEHKVNGKSKGQAYILFKSPQAATAMKKKIESFGEGQQRTKKFTVGYSNPLTNPFKTLPKDGPMRNSASANSNRGSSGAYNNSSPQQSGGYNNSSGSFRGGRGGYNNRGAGMNPGGFNRGGFNQPMASSMGGFNNSMGNMGTYGGFQNRGGMNRGMRGGMGMGAARGGMMGMPMGGMGFGGMGLGMGMGMGMNMPQMGSAMGMQGMPGSHNFPSTTAGGPPGTSVDPRGTSSSPAKKGRKGPRSGSPSGPPGVPSDPSSVSSSSPPHLRGGYAPSTWAGLTQYSSRPASTSTANPAPSTPWPSVPAFTDVGAMLRRDSLPAGPMGTQTHFNPVMFQQHQSSGSGDANWNPHGAKRTRQE